MIFDFSMAILGYFEVKFVLSDVKFGLSVLELSLHQIFSRLRHKLQILKQIGTFFTHPVSTNKSF